MDIEENEILLALQFKNAYLELYNEWLSDQTLINHEESIADSFINIEKSKYDEEI